MTTQDENLFVTDTNPDHVSASVGNNIGETHEAPDVTMKETISSSEADHESELESKETFVIDKPEVHEEEENVESVHVLAQTNAQVYHPTTHDQDIPLAAATEPLEAKLKTDSSSSDSEQSDFQFSDGEDSGEEASDSSVNEEEDEQDEKENLKPVDDDDDDLGVAPSGPIRSKNELSELPEMEPISLDIPETCEMNLVGTFLNRVDGFAIVQCSGSGDVQVLDQETPLFFGDRVPLGRIFDTFGPVKQPLYSLRMQNEDESFWKPRIGESIFVIPEYAKFVFTAPIRAKKGTDASNMYDEELGEEEIEFSDDEKEAEYKRQLKAKKRKPGQEPGDEEVPRNDKRNRPQRQQQRRPQQPHQQQQGSFPYRQTQPQMPYGGYPSQPMPMAMAQGQFNQPFPFYPPPYMYPGIPPNPYMAQQQYANQMQYQQYAMQSSNQNSGQSTSPAQTAQSALSLLQFLQSQQQPRQ